MLCDYCQKNEATNLLKQTVNGSQKLLHVCDSCAHSMMFSNLLSDFSINNMFTHGFTQSRPKKMCDKCGSTLDEIMSSAKVGCDRCYEAFAGELSRSIEKMHGKSVHTGKVPSSSSGKIQKKRLLEKYKDELKQLIEEQRFEEAAKVRDKIKELESKAQGKAETGPQTEEGGEQS